MTYQDQLMNQKLKRFELAVLAHFETRVSAHHKSFQNHVMILWRLLRKQRRMPHDFIAWFEKDSPNFTGWYGKVTRFYDQSTDSFQIEEIQTAYEEFKKGEIPSSLYFSWRHSH